MTALLGGLYGFFTNGEQKLVDLTSVLLAAILLVAQLRRPVIPGKGPFSRCRFGGTATSPSFVWSLAPPGWRWDSSATGSGHRPDAVF